MRLLKTLRSYTKVGPYVEAWTVAKTRRRVQAGPFVGMRYVKTSFMSAYLPKLLGAYEREIYPVIEEVLAADYDALLDVGVAEGYFAVGLARRTAARVIGYELDPTARAWAHELAELNGVAGRVDLRGACSPELLEADLAEASRPFVLCDVDGYEATLLDPTRVPSLAKATLLVELHEFARPGITAELFRRFADTHDMRMIWQTPRTHEDFPIQDTWAQRIARRRRRNMLDEHRPCQQAWVHMLPRAEAVVHSNAA